MNKLRFVSLVVNNIYCHYISNSAPKRGKVKTDDLSLSLSLPPRDVTEFSRRLGFESRNSRNIEFESEQKKKVAGENLNKLRFVLLVVNYIYYHYINSSALKRGKVKTDDLSLSLSLWSSSKHFEKRCSS